MYDSEIAAALALYDSLITINIMLFQLSIQKIQDKLVIFFKQIHLNSTFSIINKLSKHLKQNFTIS